MSIPVELSTSRLLLRPWRAEDAPALQPILETNQAHLGPWIPKRVSDPAPIPVLEQRLAGFGADFAADREWRFGMFARDGGDVLGEVALFPRNATGRVPLADSDRVELGYWLRSDATGQGFVTEASNAMLAAVAAIPRFSHVEIRCDERNTPSAAIPQRLGFVLMTPAVGAPEHLQVWKLELSRRRI